MKPNENCTPQAQTCPTVGTQSATICLPVSISPYAVTGPANVKCRGGAVINHTCHECHGKINGTCNFIISQKIQVDLPVEFGATVKVGDTYVDCDCAPCQDVYENTDFSYESVSDET